VSRHHNSWERDTRVKINARPLRYPRDWPNERAQEKGVDVMLALGMVRCALDATCDRVIIASRDTDLLPAIEMCEAERPGCTIIATWETGSALRPEGGVDTLHMNRQAYNRSRDPHTY